MQLVGRRYHLTRVIRWSDCISYRIEIVCLISTPSYYTTLHYTHTHNKILLLADGALFCGMYPTGKVAISQQLVTPGFPKCDHTVSKLSADTGLLCSEV